MRILVALTLVLAACGGPTKKNVEPGTTEGSDSAAETCCCKYFPLTSEDGKVHYVGLATGFVVRREDNRTIYFAGDTALFGDMRLIRELYAPEIAFLPIGDHYTMDPAAAAKACEMLGVRQVVPMHYGTFPALTGSPDDLKKLVEPLGVDVLVLKPGETAS